jgi:hypothetical protein
LPDSVFEDDAGPLSFPFEVIATKTALANAAALARHKLTITITPKPRTADVSSESSSSKDEWLLGNGDSIMDVEEESGGETEGYAGDSPAPSPRFEIHARSSATTSPKKKVPRRL